MLAVLTPFQDYVRQLTGLTVQPRAWAGEALPAYLQQRYEAHPISVAGQDWLAVLLRQGDAPAPLPLRKQLAQLAARVQPAPAGVCLVAEHLPPYLRTRLVELGQPFVVPGRQLFWPALGSAETVQRPQRLPPQAVTTLPPVAQQLLIALLLGGLLPPVTIAAAAERLGCTAASISQAVKALEAGGLVQSHVQGRERVVALAGAPAQVWQQAQPLLRSPVRQRVRVQQALLAPELACPAGETALAAQTDLAAPAEAVLAMASKHWPALAQVVPVIPVPDEGTCVLELWRYAPQATADARGVDRLSLALSLQDNPDERVQLALQELMEPWA